MKSLRIIAVLAVALALGRGLSAQQEGLASIRLSQAQLGELAQEVANSQVQFLMDAGTGVAYTACWIDGDNDYSREVIGSTDGAVARVMTEKGKPITPARDVKEQERLKSLLVPDTLRSENKSAARLLPYFLELVRAMPQAMLYRPADAQLPLPAVAHPQLVLDYSPNPAFRPRSLAERTLGKLRGIDAWIITCCASTSKSNRMSI